MTIPSKAWEKVGDSFEVLGEHVRGHFEEVGAEASAERAAFEKSVRGLLAALEDGFTAAGKAVRDPVLRDDVTKVAVVVREALLATFETAGTQMRELLPRPAPKPVKRVAAKRATPARKPAPRKPTAKRAPAKPVRRATRAAS